MSTTTSEAHKHVPHTPFHLPRPRFRKPSQLIQPLDDTHVHEVPPTASETGNSGDDEGLGPQDGVNVQDNEEPEDEDVVDPGSLFEQHLSDNAPSGSLSQQSVHRDDEENPFQYEDDTQSPNFVPNIDDIRISYKFINELRSAKLDSPIEPLDDTLLQQILDPPQHLLEVENPDERLSLELYLATTHTSEETYTNACVAVTRRFPDCRLLSYYMVKKLVEKLSGVSPIVRDMCVNSCIGYTGPYASIEDCPHCGETRYKIQGKKKIARKQFTTLPLAPQLQALWRTTEGAASMQYRQNCTKAAFEELERNNGVKVSAYKDFFDGSDYLEAVAEGKIADNDMVVLLSIDGAQLYRNKASDCWMYIWVVLDHDPSNRYKVQHVLLGGVIPGPNKPKNLDSFLFTGLYHISAIQQAGGFRIWNAKSGQIFMSNIFLALVSADGPAMSCLNGFVGHHGRVHCRFYCPLIGRHKPGGPHYYPARLKPLGFTVTGCDHDDVDINALLSSFTSRDAEKAYNHNLSRVVVSRTKTEYQARRLQTGVVKPTIFSGLDPNMMLGVPGIFAGDCMHLPALNIPDLYIPLWRGTFDCDSTDTKGNWSWAVLKTQAAWKAHGQDVVAATPFIPGSFGRPPRNPAEKISSGYKAWEFLLYFFGLGPCLFYNLLPKDYYEQYCKIVQGIRLLIQEEILPDEIRLADKLITEASNSFEELYVQRRTDRLHFVRASVHAPSHMPYETIRIGPGIIYSQWTMERMIGFLGMDIRLHSNAFANLTNIAITRAQNNALIAMFPDFRPKPKLLPRGAVDIGDGYQLRRARDSCSRAVTELEAQAISRYFLDLGFSTDDDGTPFDDNYNPVVVRWARVLLPNGQIARSRWKENLKPINKLRAARSVRVTLSGRLQYAEVHFYLSWHIHNIEKHFAVASFYGEPHQGILKQSSHSYYTVQHKCDVDVRAFDIKSISAVVMMAPDPRYGTVFQDGSEKDRYYLMEKPGLKLGRLFGWEEDDTES
ncbi:hypothetical protein LENED_012525 [Lentinula edodes]|uniref:Transposase family Tnp2 protein n=1 Tax=Lentinula edodes TaxID=5353 RepID=A0A1Q3ESW7_LENED|nr:hypothetical protein LENED_012525 [Lentinula edodes]